jgi:hypothetical protein
VTTNSYFRASINRTNNPLFFFNDHDEDSTMTAWVAACDAARAGDGHVAVWRVPAKPGPWDVAQIVGHRQRDHIETQLVHGREIAKVKPDEVTDIHGLEVELAALDAAYAERRPGLMGVR